MNTRTFSVLLVDNDPYMCEIFELILEYHDIATYIRQNVDEALAFLDEHSVSVIVIEILLPGIDGYQLARQIRDDKLAPYAKLVATSAFAQSSVFQPPNEDCFDGFIPKPFDVSEIVPYLREIAGDHQNSEASPHH